MCIQVVRKVVKIIGNTAILEDERIVRINLIQDVKKGDLLEVYGDIALGKINKHTKEDK